MVASKIIIQDWQERKRINAKLPANQRKHVEESIDDLQLPMFRADAIGAIHKAVEAFAVGQYIRTLCAQFCLIYLKLL